jgi:hypothetical protein
MLNPIFNFMQFVDVDAHNKKIPPCSFYGGTFFFGLSRSQPLIFDAAAASTPWISLISTGRRKFPCSA